MKLFYASYYQNVTQNNTFSHLRIIFYKKKFFHNHFFKMKMNTVVQKNCINLLKIQNSMWKIMWVNPRVCE